MPHNAQYLSTVLNAPTSAQQPGATKTEVFNAAQRSQQARGKLHASPTAGDAYLAREERERAAQILGSLELLIWHANARGEVGALILHYLMLLRTMSEARWYGMFCAAG